MTGLNNPKVAEESASSTLASASGSLDEKPPVAAEGAAQGRLTEEMSRSPTPTEKDGPPPLQRTVSAAERARAAELKRINTSEEGREYPTGLKLGKWCGCRTIPRARC